MHPKKEVSFFGGEGGIRTLDILSDIRAFQARPLSHSDTSPEESPGDFLNGNYRFRYNFLKRK